MPHTTTHYVTEWLIVGAPPTRDAPHPTLEKAQERAEFLRERGLRGVKVIKVTVTEEEVE